MKKVFIDAGHGAKDPGATGNGLKEKDIVLSVSLKVGEVLKRHNVGVFYSRMDDRFIELIERSTMANKLGVDVFVSLHCNSFSNEQAQGLETYSHPSSKNGTALAKCIQDSILKDKLYTKDRGIKTANFSVLRNTKMTAALTELGFISNAEDVEILKNKQNELAESIARGILNFLGIKYIEEINKVEKEIDKLYKVQVGAYSVKENANKLLKDLESKGFKGFIKEEVQEVEVMPEKSNKKLVSYKGPGNSEVIEIDPLDLYIDVVKPLGSNIKGDFINGGFFDMNKMVSISTLVCNGKVLAEQLPHDNVKRGTMVVRKNGAVSVEMVDFISKSPGLNTIKFAIGGFNILPGHGDIRRQLKSEWFDYNVVGYKTWRSMLGYSNKANKVLVVIAPNMTAEEGQALMKELGCDCAIGLDSGGSTSGRFNDKDIRLTDRRLHNIIRW